MKRDTIFSFLLITVLLASATLNVYQAREIRFLRAPGLPQPGPLRAMESSGRLVTVGYGGSRLPTVLYVFSPACHWCEENLPDLRSLVAQARTRYRFVGLSLIGIGLASYLRESNMGMDSYYDDPSPGSVRRYGLGGTPTTIVMSPQGSVLAAWRGAWLGPQGAAIEKFFRVNLPQRTAGRQLSRSPEAGRPQAAK